MFGEDTDHGSKDKLGKTINIHYSQIGRYERNEASPSADALKKMANALDVSTDYLMNGTTADLAAENIQDKTLINQFNRISELTEENKPLFLNSLMLFFFNRR